MARISHCSIDRAALRVIGGSAQWPDYPIRIDMGADVWVRMTADEAVTLRDDLSRAITEAAQKHAPAVTP